MARLLACVGHGCPESRICSRFRIVLRSTSIRPFAATDRVRNLLKANPERPITPVAVRDVLLEFDRDADPKAMLIHTHNTLKRLKKEDEVEEIESEGRVA